ncbi:MAG TPA: hypothetical protein PLL10_11165 [Elusimicrobiales bacterium]|nr:hypothetical protein [Elusimicrobiales bacterium]
MAILNPEPGDRYLTVTGAPVQILKVQEDDVLVQSLASDNRFYLPNEYPLCPFKLEAAVWEMRPGLYIARSERPKSPRTVPQKQLAPIIDALLLEGGLSMKGIAREVRRRASAACRGKNLRANIRARLYWLKKKGFKQKINSQFHLKVVPSVGMPATRNNP